MTPERLTEVLHASGAAGQGARVVAVDTTTIGAGKVGHCVRFFLTWDGDGPATIVGKFPSADERSRRTGIGSDAYRRELLFYQRLAPSVKISIPRCHLAEIDLATGDFVLLMDDAAPARGGRSRDDIALALEELTRLQAPFWGTSVNWLPTRGRRLAAIYQLVADRFTARFGDRLSTLAVSTLERFAPRVRRWARSGRPPFTVLHGDYRLDNLLFGTGPDAPPLTVVDWQTVTTGPGPSDAAYLIGGGLPLEVRRGCEEELFELYRQSLSTAGVRWNAAECRKSYVVNALTGLHLTVVGAMLLGQDDRSDAMFLEMTERHAGHIDDLNSFRTLDDLC